MKTYKVTIDENKTIRWYNEKDQLHREDGPARESSNGDKKWFLNGEAHREDGPAVEFADGYKSWYLNGELHREDGPAIECSNGDKHWYLQGKNVSEEEHKQLTSKKQFCGVDKILSDIRNYLVNAKWTPTDLFYIDPITKSKHDAGTAVCIQIDRDLLKKFGDL